MGHTQLSQSKVEGLVWMFVKLRVEFSESSRGGIGEN